jgi:hypothetical protein
VAADIQHADALRLVQHLEKKILDRANYLMTYSDAAEVLGRNPATHSRHVGQVTSRVDAACFYAKTPFLAMHRVRETESGNINQHIFEDDLWGPHIPSLIARAEQHMWTSDDFRRIKSALHSLGGDSALLQWERIQQHGQKAVQKALGL